jgi:hypothetical protein
MKIRKEETALSLMVRSRGLVREVERTEKVGMAYGASCMYLSIPASIFQMEGCAIMSP